MMSNAQSGTKQPLVEPLSAREREILSQMAERQSNQEIADALVLSLNTVKWYARQIYGKLGVNGRREAVSRARELGLLDDGVPAPLPRHNLPAQLTPFVGRQEQVATISDLMAEPASRLLTVMGPGGIGKTRLAIHAASQMRRTHQGGFRDGIFFVPLAPLRSSESLLAALAQAIGYSFYQGREGPEQQFQQ
jgi:ATP/maltotriose-dependent transcriptional regulator MalT